ncbi:arylsulfatase [Flavisolibacter nicotianae]|uniref:arylsulfatase n=1 Tax=Flavisolibacter nicotianae TaxID=2364882 RepID=UPI000EB0A960|nr:arylsulfatase [Flavisolibacter nicotianae]
MNKTTGLLFSFLLFALVAMAQRKPNVVFILADDLGYGDLGCYGQKLIKTPNLDSMAARGIRFTQFYAGTAVCAPSRASLMTGLHTGHTPVRGNFEILPEGQFPLPDSSATMAELFRKAGYVTGAFGKWGLGYPGSEGEPLNQGFDQFFGYNCQRQSHNYFPDHLWQNRHRVELENTPAHQVQYAPDLIQARAVSFIDSNKQRPFFLYLAYTLPHAGLQLPAGDSLFAFYKKQFNESPKQVPASWDGVGYQPQAYPVAAYAAMVSKLDAYVGEVLAKLKSLGLEENTLVVFTSDNGPHREGGNKPEAFASSGGLNGVKRDLYEGGIREPVLITWPAVIRKSRTSDFVGAARDFLPTFAALTGQRLTVKTDGLSLLPLLLKKGKQREHAFLYWEFHEDGGRQAVRMGKWKGVKLNVMKNGSAPLQLFDLSADPGETKDLSAVHPDVVRRVLQVMKREHVENKNFPLLVDSQQ